MTGTYEKKRRYELYRDMAQDCRMAASCADNEEIRTTWLEKANELEITAANLPVVKAMEFTTKAEVNTNHGKLSGRQLVYAV